MLHLLNYLTYSPSFWELLYCRHSHFGLIILKQPQEKGGMKGAIEANLDDIAEAIERADTYARNYDNGTYSEKVAWRFTEADETLLSLSLTDTELILIDSTGDLTTQVELSGMGTDIWKLNSRYPAIHTFGLFTKMVKQESILPRCNQRLKNRFWTSLTLLVAPSSLKQAVFKYSIL